MAKKVDTINKTIKRALKQEEMKFKGLHKTKMELAEKGLSLCLLCIGDMIYCDIVKKELVDEWYSNFRKELK